MSEKFDYKGLEESIEEVAPLEAKSLTEKYREFSDGMAGMLLIGAEESAYDQMDVDFINGLAEEITLDNIPAERKAEAVEAFKKMLMANEEARSKVSAAAKVMRADLEIGEEVFKKTLDDKLPENLQGFNFYEDADGVMRREGFSGHYTLLNDGALFYVGVETGPVYLNAGADMESAWIDAADVEAEKLLPVNARNKDFFVDSEGELRRKGAEGIYEVQADESIVYRDAKGIQVLDAGENIDLISQNWLGLETPGWRSIEDESLQAHLPNNLKDRSFYTDHLGQLRRENNSGKYELFDDGSVVYESKTMSATLAPGADPDKDWEFSRRPMSFTEWQSTQKQIAQLMRTDLDDVRADGLARLYKPQEVEKMMHGYTQKQKLEMLGAFAETTEISEPQRYRLLQVGMIKTMIETMIADIKDDGSKNQNWSEEFRQWTEFEGTTHNRVHHLRDMLNSLDTVADQIAFNPEVKLNDLIGDHMKSYLTYYGQFESFTGWEDANYLAGFVDQSGNIIDASNFEQLQMQQLALMQYLRFNKDYATAQILFEEVWFGPQFEKERESLLSDAATKREIENEADRKVADMVADNIEDWQEKGMTREQIAAYKEELVNIWEKRVANKRVAEMFNGLPFDLQGAEASLQLTYKDMMGTGEWYNLADSTWDMILEELVINAPLIIGSAGVASVARAGLSAGARAVVGTSRLARIGLSVEKLHKGGRMVEAITATGRLGKSLYWAGRGGGLLFEGLVFETTHSGLQGKNLFDADFPDWAKRVLWSSATLGAFKVTNQVASKFTKNLSSKIANLKKVPASLKSAADAAQKIAIGGGSEVAVMLGIGTAQRMVEQGLASWDDLGLDDVLHAVVSVASLRTVGGGLAVGKEVFFPDPVMPGARRSAKSEGTAPEGAPSRPVRSKARERARKGAEAGVRPVELVPRSARGKVERAIETGRNENVVAKNGKDFMGTMEALDAVGFKFEVGKKGEVIARKGNQIITLREGGALSRAIGSLQSQARRAEQAADRGDLKTALRERRSLMGRLQRLSPVVMSLFLTGCAEHPIVKGFNNILTTIAAGFQGASEGLMWGFGGFLVLATIGVGYFSVWSKGNNLFRSFLANKNANEIAHQIGEFISKSGDGDARTAAKNAAGEAAKALNAHTKAAKNGGHSELHGILVDAKKAAENAQAEMAKGAPDAKVLEASREAISTASVKLEGLKPGTKDVIKLSMSAGIGLFLLWTTIGYFKVASDLGSDSPSSDGGSLYEDGGGGLEEVEADDDDFEVETEDDETEDDADEKQDDSAKNEDEEKSEGDTGKSENKEAKPAKKKRYRTKTYRPN